MGRLCFLAGLLVCTMLAYGQQLQMGHQGKQTYDRHVVAPGETLFSIARKYQTTVAELRRINNNLTDNTLRAGSTLLVPIVRTPSTIVRQESPAQTHIVQKGETLYSIAKKYGHSVDQLKQWNHLNTDEIQIGQSLTVGVLPQRNIIGPPTEDKIETRVEERPREAEHQVRNATIRPRQDREPLAERVIEPVQGVEVHEQGVALWSQTDYDGGAFYALHPTAPRGTEITVTNRMNGRSVVVKVIGQLPVLPDSNNVIIRISESAARHLNAVDERFLVQLKYTLPKTIAKEEK